MLRLNHVTRSVTGCSKLLVDLKRPQELDCSYILSSLKYCGGYLIKIVVPLDCSASVSSKNFQAGPGIAIRMCGSTKRLVLVPVRSGTIKVR